MKKLELKHLAPYLPYGLKCRIKDYPLKIGDEYTDAVATLNGIYSDGSCVFHDIVESHQGFQMVKPLLHPLSRLTETIRHDGVDFVPLILLTQRKQPMGSNHKISPERETDNPNYTYIDFEIKNLSKTLKWLGYKEHNRIGFCVKNPIYMQFIDFEQLIRWHFDVFGLIEKGLAEPIKPKPQEA